MKHASYILFIPPNINLIIGSITVTHHSLMCTPGTKDSEALSVNGEDVTITTTQEIPDGVDPVDLPVLDRRHRVDIATSGGWSFPGVR